MKVAVLLLAAVQVAFALAQNACTNASSCDAQSGASTINSPLPPGVFLQSKLSMEAPQTPGAKMAKVRYGPLHIPAMAMVENRPYFKGEMPCTECYITAMQGGLELTNGTSINIDDGAWLHHMVLYIKGENRTDFTCAGKGIFGGIGRLLPSERMFASGNERTPTRINGKEPYGIKVNQGDKMWMLYDLVNNIDQERDFWVTMMFEYLPYAVKEAAPYKEAKMMWLDVTNCGDSEVPAQHGQYALSSSGFISYTNSKVLSAFGHVHDGGQVVTVAQNGKSICESPQLYGREKEFIEPMSGAGSMNPGLAHISDVGTCLDAGTMSVGDNLTVLATYDTNKNPLNKEMNGSDQDIMGIAITYVSVE